MAEHPVSEPEEWRPVPGHPGYEASSLGRVRSLDRLVQYRDGRRALRKGIVLRSVDGIGYAKYATISLGRGHKTSVHSIVCAAFHGAPPSGKHQVAHWDGDCRNNHPANLRWATPRQNKEDEIRHGTRRLGSRNNMAKLTERDVRAIRILRATHGLSLRDIGDCFDITHDHVRDVINRVVWKHVA